MSTDFTSKNIEKFDCEICDFKCCKKGDYNRHVLTSKHKKQTEINGLSTNFPKNTITTVESFICSNCNKQYKERSGLWRHIKNCKHENITIIEDNQIVAFSHEVSAKQGKSEQNFVPHGSRREPPPSAAPSGRGTPFLLHTGAKPPPEGTPFLLHFFQKWIFQKWIFQKGDETCRQNEANKTQ